MLLLGGKAKDYVQAVGILEEAITSGAACNKLKEMIAAQGGKADIVDFPEQLPAADTIIPVHADGEGWIESVAAEEIGLAAMNLGAGRATKEDKIDLGVGIVLHKRSGERVVRGDTLAELHVSAGRAEAAEAAGKQVLAAFRLAERPVEPKPLVYAVVTKDGVQSGDKVWQ
jgi:pyrimidine-nucleoside phosphorylase